MPRATASAVADWRPDSRAEGKLKKVDGEAAPLIRLARNPDILATIARSNKRPALVIGFAAETENVAANGEEKRRRKGCDWIVANDVSAESGVMGGDSNRVHLISAAGVEDWPLMNKADVGRRLAQRIGAALKGVAE